jgi:hypothetical protein
MTDTTQLTGNLIEYAKAAKAASLLRGEKGMPPTAIAERGGEVVMSAVAPDCDKGLGLNACHVLRTATDADRITLLMDANRVDLKPAPGEQVQYPPPGSLQQRREAGDEKVVECLVIVSADRCGRSLRVLDYRVEDGQPAGWAEADMSGAENAGTVPEFLAECMAHEPVYEVAAREAKSAGVPFPPDRETQMRIVTEQAAKFLRHKGFTVYLSGEQADA